MQKLKNWFLDLSIYRKEISLIALMSFFLLLTGLTGLYLSYQANHRLHSIYRHRLLPIKWLNGARANFRANEANVYRVIFSKNVGLRQSSLADIERRTRGWEVQIADYKRTELDPYEIQQISILQRETQTYIAARSKALRLAANGNQVEALNTYDAALPILNDMTMRLRNLSDYNERAADRDYKNAVRAGRIANTLIILSILLGLALSTPLGFYIAHLITNPLSILAAKMKKVSEGNLDVEPAEVRSLDEVGSVSESFNIMADNLRNLIQRETLLRQLILSSVEYTDLKTTLKIIVQETGKIFNADHCFFIPYDSQQNTFTPIQDYGSYTASPSIKAIVGLKITNEQMAPFTRMLFEQKQPIAVNDVTELDIPAETVELLKSYNVISFIAAPLFYEDKPTGILIVSCIKYRQFNENDVRLLTAIANQSVLVLRQAQLFLEVQEARDREYLLRKLISTVRGTLDINETFKSITKEVAGLFNAERVIILNYPDPKNFKKWILEYDYVNSPDMIPSEGAPLDPEAGIYWGEFILNKGEILAVDDVAKADISAPLKYNCEVLGIRAITGIPIRKGEDIWGTLSIAMSHPRHWTKNELDFLQPISDQVYLAINQAELYSNVSKTAEREGLIREIINVIRSSLDKSEVKNKIVTTIGNTLNVERCFINEFNPETGEFEGVEEKSEYRSSPELSSYIGFEFRKDIPGYEIIPDTIRANKILLINDVEDFIQEYPDVPFVEYIVKSVPFKSSLGIPIKYADKVLGALVLQFQTKKYTFDEEFINFASTLADQAGIALYQARLYNKAQNTAEREAFLRRIIETIRSSLNIDEILRTICREVGEVFNVQRVSISQHPPDIIRAEYKAHPDIMGLENLDFDKKIADFWGKSLESELDYVAVDNVDEAKIPNFLKEFYKSLNTKSVLGIPIKRAQEKWGGLVLAQTDNYRHWTQDEINLLITISGQIFTAIKQAELYSSTQKLAERETLLRKIISTVRNTLNINEIEQGITNEVGMAFKADRCFFRVYNRDQDQFLPVRVEYLSSPDVPSIIGATFPESKYGGFKKRYKQGEIHLFPDLEACLNEPECDKTGIKALIEDYQIKSNYGISIFYEDKFLGVFVLHYTKNKVLLDNDSIQLLVSVASQAGIALNQAELYTATKRDAERSGAISRIAEAIGGSLDLDEIMTTICRELLTLFNVDRVTAATFPRSEVYTGWSRLWEVKGKAEYPDTTRANFSDRSRKWLANLFIREAKDSIINNYNDTSLPDYFRQDCNNLWLKSSLNVPIKRGNEVWGGLAIHTIENYRIWTQDEIDLMHTIVDYVFIAVRQAELYANTQRAAERESLLRTINNQILTSHDINEAFNAIVNEIGKIYNVDRVVLRFYEPASRSFSAVRNEYKKSEAVPSAIGSRPYPKEVNEYFIQELIEKKRIISFVNIYDSQYPDYLKDIFKHLDIKSTLVAPMLYGENILGIIFLTYTEKPGNYSETDIELLQDITSQISIGIHLFDLTNKLTKSLESERAVREIIFETRKQENHDLVFGYMLGKLLEIFKADRAIHLHCDEHRNLYVKNERLINADYEPMCNKPVLTYEKTLELEPKTFGDIIIVNDILTEIKDEGLREYLTGKNIISFMLYPIAQVYSVHDQEKPSSTIMLSSSKPRIWTQNEVDSFRLTVDATSLVYLELRQRKETEETRNTFLATLTHDLRSPLNAEQKALEVILSKRLGTSLEGFSEYLEDMYNTNRELLRIVENILSVYHYEEGKFELKLQEVNITELISSSVSSMRPLAKEENSEINIEIQPDIPSVMADRDEILRVINNLISNAIKHNEKGTTINVTAKKFDNEVKVSVSDNGKGIPESERPNIFQRYPTTKRKIGTGLGLYLSKQIIDAHNGRIWFDTEVGKGTTFYFTIPIA